MCPCRRAAGGYGYVWCMSTRVEECLRTYYVLVMAPCSGGFCFRSSSSWVWPAGQSLHYIAPTTMSPTYWLGENVQCVAEPSSMSSQQSHSKLSQTTATTPHHAWCRAIFSSGSSILPARFDPPKLLPAGWQTLCVRESIGCRSVMHTNETCVRARQQYSKLRTLVFLTPKLY
jgi:hypothetical protein